MSTALAWFPFYLNDWETDEQVRRLSWEERGIYLAMLCWQWREGSLPGRAADVARTLGIRTAVAQRLLRRFFVSDGHGGRRVVNRRLAELYAHQLGKSDKARQAAMISHSRRIASAEQSQDGRTAEAGRSRSRIRSEIQTSLDSASAQSKVKGEA